MWVRVAPRRYGRRQQFLEVDRVDERVVQRVPVAGAGNGIVTERGAQPGDMMLDGVSRSGGQVRPPQRVDQVVHRDDAAFREGQDCQQRLPFPAGYVDAPSARDDLERAEEPDLQPIAHTYSEGMWATSVPRPDSVVKQRDPYGSTERGRGSQMAAGRATVRGTSTRGVAMSIMENTRRASSPTHWSVDAEKSSVEFAVKTFWGLGHRARPLRALRRRL